MIDLGADDATIRDYVRRYDHLRPLASQAVARRVLDDPNGARAQTSGATDGPPDWLQPSGIRPEPESRALDRAAGAFLGLAIGDALGATLEFTRRDTSLVTDLVGGGTFGLDPGEWTDDTSMALCLADTLLARGFDPRMFAERLAGWYRQGENTVKGRCFDIGNATRAGIEAYLSTGRSQAGPSDPRSAGNGSLVRLAPLVIFFRHALHRTWTLAQAQSKATHNAAEALSACQLFGVILWHAMQGAPKPETLAARVLPLQPRLTIIDAGEYKTKTRDQIRSSGYVIDTLEAALWCIWTTDNFRDAVLLAANLADDSDSVAATAGQLAGALYGLSGIPDDWRRRVAWGDRIVSMANRLFAAAPPP